MRSYRFIQVDVFTERPFGGNPLAVFPEAEGLSAEEMQGRAAFAGHPVVGTHWVLAHLGRVELREPVTRMCFELGVGVLPADLHVVGGRVERVVMTQGRPSFHTVLEDVGELAAALELPPEAITATGLPVQVVSTGLPQMMVPVRGLAEVQRLASDRLDLATLTRVCRAAGTDCVMVFTLETESSEATVHTRMFAPSLGVPEDPATGSASGALGAYLVHHRAVPVSEPTTCITSEQGLELGRPSRLYVEVDSSEGEIAGVRVGGQVVAIAEGEVRF